MNRQWRHCLIGLAVMLACSSCAPDPALPTADPSQTTQPTAPIESTDATGPHSPPGRKQAESVVTRTADEVIRAADFGDITLGAGGEFRAPVRGYLVTPVGNPRHTPLVVLAHLRYPACADGVFAFPCPQDDAALRFDSGMVYLATDLAAKGYSVLVPDLAPVYVGADTDQPYDQRAAVQQILDVMLTQVDAATRGQATRWGEDLAGVVDTSHIGLFAHSRSATIAGDLVSAMAGGEHQVASVLVYGGAYDVYYHGEPGTTAAMPDVPLLAVVGAEDQDTGFSASMWLGEHIATPRKSPKLAAVVPGLGRTYINRTLSSLGVDDRICEGNCPDAAKHERFLTQTATQWFDATLRGRSTSLPIRGTDALPGKLGGSQALWLAATNGERASAFVAGVHGTLDPFGPDGRASTCFPTEPMAPSFPDDCPIPARAVTWGAAPVTQIRVAPGSGVRLVTGGISHPTGIAVHLAPSDDRADGQDANPLLVQVSFTDGRTVSIPLSGGEPALRNRATPAATGVYSVGTVRAELPSWAHDATIQSITLTGNGATSAFDLRAIDISREDPATGPGLHR